MKIFISCLIVIVSLIKQEDQYSLARKAEDDKQYQVCIAICNAELGKLDVKSSLFEKFLLIRADVFLDVNDYKSSIKDYLQLTELYPDSASYYAYVSYPYGEIGDYKNCLAVLKKAINIDHNNTFVLNNLSYYSSKVGNYNDAINYADKGIKIVKDPKKKGDFLSNKCYGLLGLKRYSDALIIINESIRLDPDNSFAYCFRAMANIGLKHFSTVCNDLNTSKSLGGIKLTEDLRNQYCK